jgi:UDP-3-O-acyl-N-acetylglucosamine deacetylase
MDFNTDEFGEDNFNYKGDFTAQDLLDFLEDLEFDGVDLSEILIAVQDGHRLNEIRNVIDETDNNVIILKK